MAQTKEYCAFQVGYWKVKKVVCVLRYVYSKLSEKEKVTGTFEVYIVSVLGALHRSQFKNSGGSRFIQCNCQILLDCKGG